MRTDDVNFVWRSTYCLPWSLSLHTEKWKCLASSRPHASSGACKRRLSRAS